MKPQEKDASGLPTGAKHPDHVSDVAQRELQRTELSQRIGRLLARHWLRKNRGSVAPPSPA